MVKKLSLFLAALVASALAMPAFASAGRITQPLEVLAPVGTKITATSTRFVILTSLGSITCKGVVFNGELTENGGGNYNVIGVGEGSVTSCNLGKKAAFPADLTLFSLGEDVGAKRIVVTMKFVLAELTCHFASKTAPGFLEYSVLFQRPEFALPPQELAASPEACQPGEIEANFSIEETGGGVLLFD